MNPRYLLLVTTLLMLAAEADELRDSVVRVVELQHTEIWSKGNTELIPQIYAADFVGYFPGGTVRGHAGIRAQIEAHRQAFPDWNEEIEDVIYERDRVVTRFTSRGTNLGPFLGNAPTGRSITISEVSIYRIADGKIAEQWVYPDMRSMQQQLYGGED